MWQKKASELVYFLFGLLGKNSWNWVGAKYGIESAISHKTLIFKAGIDFSSPFRQRQYSLQ
jgi:hypothetical protein